MKLDLFTERRTVFAEAKALGRLFGPGHQEDLSEGMPMGIGDGDACQAAIARRG